MKLRVFYNQVQTLCSTLKEQVYPPLRVNNVYKKKPKQNSILFIQFILFLMNKTSNKVCFFTSNSLIKGQVHPKMKILSLSSHPHADGNSDEVL